MFFITAEHFGLTEALRAHLEKNLAKVEDALPKNTYVRVFLSAPSPRSFRALLKVRVRGRDLVAWAAGEDLYSAITEASRTLLTSVRKERWASVSRSSAQASQV